MILSKAFDVEILPNFLSVTFVDMRDYFNIFADCVNEKGKPIPLTEKLPVKEIKARLAVAKHDAFYITDKDDSQLFPLINYIQNTAVKIINDTQVRTDLFGYNNASYDNLMMAAILANCMRFDNVKDFIYNLYLISKKIISLQDNPDLAKRDYVINSLRKFKLPYTSIDVMKVFALNKVGSMTDKNGKTVYIPKGLKQVSINLKWYELLEYTMPPITEKDKHFYDTFKDDLGNSYKGMTVEELNQVVKVWDRFILEEYIPEMMHYNLNDVFIVAEMARLFPDEIKLRYSLSSSYKVNLLSSSRSNIANILFEKFYSEFSGLHPSQWKGQKTIRTTMAFNKVIFPIIKFKTKYMQDYLERIRNVKVTRTNKDSFEETIQIGNLKYTMATGGLHSQDPPRALYSKHEFMTSSTGEQTLTPDSYTYIHWDIASFYPSIMAVYHVAPKHLIEDIFAKLVKYFRDTRVKAKHSKEDFIDGIPPKLLAEAFKIVINSIYGKFGDENSPIFDRMATLRVTINGQLMILMLCEELELNGIEVVSANTDGIVIKLYESKRETFNDIANRWKEYTGLDADSEEYSCYINADINNYIVRELNGSITYKGRFNPRMYIKDLKTGYDMPIVAKAVENYFLYDISVTRTLYNSTDILDFCRSQNVGKQFHVEETFVENGKIIRRESQRYVRYYVSNTGTVIEKVNNSSDKIRSKLCSGYYSTILNTLDDKPISERNINYRFYYAEAMKIINPIKLNIGNKKKSTLKKMTGMYNTLFDE